MACPIASNFRFPVFKFLNGRPKTSHHLKISAKYVQRNDDLLGMRTINETLKNTAAFYIPDPAAQLWTVLNVLMILGLTAHGRTKLETPLSAAFQAARFVAFL